MITLRDKDTGNQLGSISEEDLQTLINALEEESADDTDYYIDSATIDMLEEDGAAPALVALLRTAVQGREGVDLSWSRE